MSESSSENPAEKKSRMDSLLEFSTENSSHKAPQYQMTIDESVQQAMDEALEIIARYRTQGFEVHIGIVDDDLAKLAAIEVYIAQAVGEMQGLSSDYDSARRMFKSNRFVTMKGAAESLKVKITDSEADHLSRMASEAEYDLSTEMETASRVLWNFHRSLGHFIDIVSSCAHRETRQRMIT